MTQQATLTCEAYLALFPTLREAVEFEDSVLQAGREHLPPCARDVFDDGDPTPEYWAWLASQLSAMRQGGTAS